MIDRITEVDRSVKLANKEHIFEVNKKLTNMLDEQKEYEK